MLKASLLETLRELGRSGLGAPLLMLALLAMVIIPLPPVALDLLFTFNISLSLVVLLASIYVLKPLDFPAFPTVLLLATLLRLGLNVASSRVVLLNGHASPEAAGQVIAAFGEFVVGGNYVVGLAVFTILVIINFIVITKGAARISEVSARFTLDALPGKQMAIDADLNAGLINPDEAKQRRTEIIQEADFYGAMDGASKFVRGDAIAGILILFINLIGGITVGIVQHGLPLSEASHNYALLTVGDGLVAQIPALLLSTAAALMVTRVSAAQEMGQQIVVQLFGSPKALAVTSGIIGLMGLIPGMPNMAFLSLAGISAALAYRIAKQKRELITVSAPVVGSSTQRLEPEEITWDNVAPVDIIGLEVGYRLVPLVDKNQGGQLLARIKGVRKKLSQELGFLIPPVHVRDNLDLTPNGYRLSLLGVVMGQAEVYPEHELAINPGQVFGTIPGLVTKDPAFGLEAIWIEPAYREQAQMLGYTVVDASTVVATHLNQLLMTHAAELLGHEEAQQLLNRLAKSAPKLVEDLVPKTLPLRVVVRVLQNLLMEQVPIRDMRTIVETLAEHAGISQDPAVLTAAVRVRLGRFIVQNISGLDEELPVITLDPSLDQLLQQSAQLAGEGGGALEPGLAERLYKALMEAVKQQEANGQPAVLSVSPLLRPMLARFIRNALPRLQVLAYNEIPDDKRIRIAAVVGR